MSEVGKYTLLEKIEIKEARRIEQEAYEKKGREQCKQHITAFIECAKGRSISVAWACRAENNDMKVCLRKFKDVGPQE